MSRKILSNPYTGETLKEPLIVAEDHILNPEDFYGIEVESPSDVEDASIHPLHYQSYVKGLNIEAIDCMRAAFGDDAVANFCICNALKYVYRHQSKGGKTDIQKAIWYLDKYLELNP